MEETANNATADWNRREKNDIETNCILNRPSDRGGTKLMFSILAEMNMHHIGPTQLHSLAEKTRTQALILYLEHSERTKCACRQRERAISFSCSVL